MNETKRMEWNRSEAIRKERKTNISKSHYRKEGIVALKLEGEKKETPKRKEREEKITH